MRNFINILLFVTLISNLYSQSGKDFGKNFIDSKNKKQGDWKIYSLDTVFAEYHYIIVLDSTHPKSEIVKEVYYTLYKEGFYKDNKKDSLWIIYDLPMKWSIYDTLWIIVEKGLKKYEVSMKNDSIEGTVIEFYENGNRKVEFEIRKSKVEGKIICYYTNGKKKYEGIIKPDIAFFDGAEYAINGRKLKDRKFNTLFIKSEWINIDDLLMKLNE